MFIWMVTKIVCLRWILDHLFYLFFFHAMDEKSNFCCSKNFTLIVKKILFCEERTQEWKCHNWDQSFKSTANTSKSRPSNTLWHQETWLSIALVGIVHGLAHLLFPFGPIPKLCSPTFITYSNVNVSSKL